MWQAEFIAARLRELDASLDVKLLGMTTKGDRWLNSPLSEVGGKGLFVKELELAIAAGDADLAVHSCKDLPAQLPSGFELIATGYRADVRDVLVSPRFGRVDGLPEGARVGTSSLRASIIRQRWLITMWPTAPMCAPRSPVCGQRRVMRRLSTRLARITP